MAKRCAFEIYQIICLLHGYALSGWSLLARRRIHMRGRRSEKHIPTDYITNLNNLYEEWTDRYKLSPIMVWDSESQDYMCNFVDRIELHKQIEQNLFE